MKMYTPPKAEISRSTFHRNHGYKSTFSSGVLVPFYVDEALPGDTFNLKVSIFARLATALVPVMDNMFMDVQFFAVPNRLVWNNWQKFCGEQETPNASTDYTVPSFPPGTGWSAGTLADYFGLPTQAAPVGSVMPSALPFRAYKLIWNQWYRDQNLQVPVPVDLDDGPDDPAYSTNLLRRGKRADYFTTCLPWPQKGPGVEIPLSGYPLVVPLNANSAPTFNGSTAGGPAPLTSTAGASDVTIATTIAGSLNWADPKLAADLSSGTGGSTINDLRQAVQIQRMYERDARGGTRYVELLKSHFGVTSPDARLQRPEYLGGASIPINVNPVAQTAPQVTDSTPQGNLAGYGIVAASGVGFTKSFVEHSIIIGLVSVRADMTYQQNTNRMWLRKTRFDFFWPALAHLGEQAVTNQEIYNYSNPTTVFGYQERWAEYRYYPSQVTGKFRSNDPQSLDFWHLAQDFGNTQPVLGPTFIEERPPIARVIAVPGTVQNPEPEFLFDSHFQLKCARPMPLYSVPGMMDHF